jgi:hypothetical protein
MKKINICEEFIEWGKLFFTNATAAVNLNSNPGEDFKIERGVRQGCPLAPYLFLIVGKILIHMIKKAVNEKVKRSVLTRG